MLLFFIILAVLVWWVLSKVIKASHQRKEEEKRRVQIEKANAEALARKAEEQQREQKIIQDPQFQEKLARMMEAWCLLLYVCEKGTLHRQKKPSEFGALVDIVFSGTICDVERAQMNKYFGQQDSAEEYQQTAKDCMKSIFRSDAVIERAKKVLGDTYFLDNLRPAEEDDGASVYGTYMFEREIVAAADHEYDLLLREFDKRIGEFAEQWQRQYSMIHA